MKLQKIVLALSIAIVLNALLFFVGVVLFGRPEYKDFCREYTTQNSCEKVGFKWNQEYGTCEPNRAQLAPCREKLKQAWSNYDDSMLALRVAAGTIILIIGLFVALGGISPGLTLGGLTSIAIGCWTYWTWDHPHFKLIVLGITLIFLILSGYIKFRNNKNAVN